MSRSGLLLIGIWVLVVGYAIAYSGLTDLHPEFSPSGKPVGILDGLLPGAVKGAAPAKATKAKGVSARGGAPRVQ